MKRPHLVGQFLAHADDLVGRPHVVDLRPLPVFGFEQAVDAIERHAPVVADDATAAVGIRKPGNDAGLAALADFVGVGVEHAVVVALAVFRERLVDLRIGLESSCLEACLDHAQAAEGKNGPLERFVGLQSDDDFVGAVNIPGVVRQQGRR